MSTLAAVEVVEEHKSAPPLVVVPPKAAEKDEDILDQHPLVPVFIAGIIALALSGAMIGSILLLLFSRNSGVMAP